MNSSMVVLSQPLAWNSSFFSRLKKLSQAALSGEQALLDIERMRRAPAIQVGQPGHR